MSLPLDAAQPGTPGYRLQEEMERLTLTFGELARLSTINRNRLTAILTNSTSKDMTMTELQLLTAKTGIDLNYVLVGIRITTLTPEEQALVDNYRAASEQQRRNLEAHSNSVAEQMSDVGNVNGVS